ncbi:MAG: hypothetical protein ACOCNY_02405 [Prevotella sp.]
MYNGSKGKWGALGGVVIQRHTGLEAIATKLLLTVLAESGMIPLFGLLKNEKADRKSKKNS